MQKCCRNLTLHGQDAKHDLHLSGQKYISRLPAPRS
jgi:trimethylamine:corrinoid methyltransferase-like protein